MLDPSFEGIRDLKKRNIWLSPLREMILAASRAEELISNGNKRKAVGTSQMSFSNTERAKKNGFYGLVFWRFFEQLEKRHVRDEPKSVSHPEAHLCPASVGFKPASNASDVSPCSGRLGGCAELHAAVVDGCSSPKS